MTSTIGRCTAVVAGSGRLRDLVVRGLRSAGVGSVVTKTTDELATEAFEGDIVVLAGGATQSEAESVDAASRRLGVPFVWADACSSGGFVFDDFGESYTVLDSPGDGKVLVVTGVTQDAAGGIVTIDDNDTLWPDIRVGMTRVAFSGMKGEGGKVLENRTNGHLVTEIVGDHAFRIDTDTSSSSPFSGCGYVTTVPVQTAVRFAQLADSLKDNKAAEQTTLSVLSSTTRSLPSDMMICGIVCSEVVKGLTGAHAPTPVQWILQDFSVPKEPSLAGMKIHVLCTESVGHTKDTIAEMFTGMGGNKDDLSFGDAIDGSAFEGLDACITVNADIAAVQQIADSCISHEKPLFVASTTGPKGEVQVVIPHKTAAFDASRHQAKEADYPLCVLQNFPYRPEHAVSWAQSKLGDIVGAAEKPAPSALFDDFFCSGIEKLLSSCQDTLWSGLKRRPHPIKYDSENALHRAFVEAAERIARGDSSPEASTEFVCAAASLRADNYDMPRPRFSKESSPSWSSTSVAMGLLLCEVSKYAENARHGGNHAYANSSFDLGKKAEIINTFVPQAPLPVEQGSKWTVWDCATVRGEGMTLLDFVKSLRKKYHGTVTAVIYRGRTILITKKNRKMGIIETLEAATKSTDTFGSGAQFVCFDVIAEDANGDDVDIPRVRYYPTSK